MRTFTSPTTDRPGGPIQFQLDGTGVITGKAWAEQFTCVPEVNSGVLDDLASSMVQLQNGDIHWNQPSLLRVMRGCLVDEDVRRFDQLVHDKDRVVHIDTLGELVLWLAEELVGRPTGGRSASTPGAQPAARTSPAASSSRVGVLGS